MKIDSRRLGLALLAIVGTLVWAPSVGANVILSNGNSTVGISETTSAGAYEWIVDGQNMLYQQWFWYRVGSTGGESPINTLAAPVVTTFLGTRGVVLDYVGTGITVETTYILTGGSLGSTRSDMAEVIAITNTGTAPIDFHFFQYSDFDLCSPGGDTVNVLSGNQVRQSDGTCSLSETVVAPAANLWQVGAYPGLLNLLSDGSPTTLNGLSSFGPGDATWAYEWDVNLGAGQSFLISKDKSIQPIPEPATLTLVGIGSGLVALARKRRKAA
jgi:hypothetical protein